MKAIIIEQPGAPEKLLLKEIDSPAVEEGEVLVNVKAISINPVDVKSRSGKGVYGRIKDENPLILGWDISGTVSESRSSKFSIGDEVYGMVNFPGHGKAYAEYVAAPADQLAIKPINISHPEAAAATLAALTAWQALVHHAKVAPGHRILIHAAAGGVGHFAVQIAKHLGAHVTGTSSSKNRDFVLALGADAHIDYQEYDWSTHPAEFEMVLDCVGGETIDHSVMVTKKGGTIISIPTGLSESVTEKAKSKGINGYFILVSSSGKDMEHIADLQRTGILKANVFKSYPFTKMAEAHLQVESGRTVGKVVISLV